MQIQATGEASREFVLLRAPGILNVAADTEVVLSPKVPVKLNHVRELQ